MALEIERKFLVRDESWRAHCAYRHEIRDGLIAIADGRKVRVRMVPRFKISHATAQSNILLVLEARKTAA